MHTPAARGPDDGRERANGRSAVPSATDLAALIRTKKVGCLELLDTYLERLAKYNPRLDAIIATDLEAARRRARAAD